VKYNTSGRSLDGIYLKNEANYSQKNPHPWKSQWLQNAWQAIILRDPTSETPKKAIFFDE
jgi:hypothetical protein